MQEYLEIGIGIMGMERGLLRNVGCRYLMEVGWRLREQRERLGIDYLCGLKIVVD